LLPETGAVVEAVGVVVIPVLGGLPVKLLPIFQVLCSKRRVATLHPVPVCKLPWRLVEAGTINSLRKVALPFALAGRIPFDEVGRAGHAPAIQTQCALIELGTTNITKNLLWRGEVDSSPSLAGSS
jgi:hypothetical protein